MRFTFYKWRDIIYRKIFRKKYKHFDAFGSHLPIIIAMGIFKNPKRVLELGSGLNSTRLFLDKKCFSQLKKFESVENNPEWYEKLKDSFAYSGSSHLIYYQGDISEYVQSLTDCDYDLIFIDDSMETPNRVETIKAVFNSAISDAAIVLIHDFEVWDYQDAAKLWPYRYSFTSFQPNVGVIWKAPNIITEKDLDFIRKKIETYKWDYSIYDSDKWINCFEEGMIK